MIQKNSEYTTFPRTFKRYKWFKPILVALLTALFASIGQIVCMVIGALWTGQGVDAMMTAMERGSDIFYEGPGVFMAVGGVATMLPALALAALIVRDRPFSSYSLSRGGWSWSGFFKCLAVAAVVFGVVLCTEAFLFPDAAADHMNKFNLLGLVLCLVLVPIQASAEEYIFRGFLMQTLGSWTKLPVLAMLLSSLVFAVVHSYEALGLIAVFVHGIVYALLTRRTKGLEAGCASHMVNNLFSFIFTGLGISSAGEGGLESLVAVIVISVIYAAAVLSFDSKFGWFQPKESLQA